MKTAFKFVSILLFTFALVLTSCRKEESEFIETPPEDTLEPNSLIADLMLRTVTNDGSNDNILDLANCINIKLPITVTANSTEIVINSETDYNKVEYIFDEEYDDINVLNISFPITIVYTDYSEAIMNNIDDLYNTADICNGENIADEDIECIDFVYPFSVSIFNTNNEQLSTEVFTNDKELYHFIKTISTEDIVSIDFPISVELTDNSQFEIYSMTELQTSIENHQNDCDEDDDFDHDDDDCDQCTQELVADFLTGCQDWYVDKLKKNNVDYNTIYDGYDFNFFTNGTVSVYWNSTTAYGSWSITGTANDIILTIDIPTLPLCNNNWELQEINNNTGLTKVDFILNTDDRLRYRNNCN
ncbi:hypothetical protein [Psychroserpens ponticola]|uniref:Uncharacterized protein n=1 Tax=Psychroserpens ponticola TaxID=2932268 RepID=A0ABY7RU24_9FLAO|nr:hypothetical protein [Psychroserpens ponticola]WCO00623.1 hypothetical protein MUN68_011155 [Psychroserpens ponticola]